MRAYRCEKCEGVAFYITNEPKSGERVSSSQAMLIDGGTPEYGSPMVCGSCQAPIGRPLMTNRLFDVEMV